MLNRKISIAMIQRESGSARDSRIGGQPMRRRAMIYVAAAMLSPKMKSEKARMHNETPPRARSRRADRAGTTAR